MNIKKQITILAVAGLCAGSARAGYTFTTGAADNTPTTGIPGQSGVSEFTITFQGGVANWTSTTLGTKHAYTAASAAAIGEYLNITASTPANSHYQVLTDAGVGNYDTFSSISIDKADSTLALGTGVSYAENVPYTIFVDWTLNPQDVPGDSPAGIYLDLAINDPNGSYNEVETQAQINVAAVPEPAQTMAGGMLLGCGMLVFIGRRLLKKKAA